MSNNQIRRPRGRPRLPDVERKSIIVGVRLSPVEYDILVKNANGVPVAIYLRWLGTRQ